MRAILGLVVSIWFQYGDETQSFMSFSIDSFVPNASNLLTKVFYQSNKMDTTLSESKIVNVLVNNVKWFARQLYRIEEVDPMMYGVEKTRTK